MGVVSNKIDITDLQLSGGGGDPTLPGRVSALETVVGDSTSGLVKDVDDLETVVGDSTSGLVKDVDELKGATATIYSTTEKIIGEWIDGKPIYQKTIYFGALPNSTSKSVAHGISNFDKLLRLFGTLDGGALQSVIPLSYPDGITYNVGAYVTSTDVVIKTGTDRTSDTAYVTIQYTKTTD